MRSGPCRNNLGQTAMTDAILFMTLMVIACAVVIGSTQGGKGNLVQRNGLQQYTEDFAGTLLAMELRDLYYTDVNGDIVDLSGRSIGQLLSEEVVLLSGGAPASGFADGYEPGILDAGKALVREGIGFALVSEGGGQTSKILVSYHIDSIGDLPADRCASQMEYFVGNCETVTITVYVWVM